MSIDPTPSAAERDSVPSSTPAVEDSANPLTVRVGLFLVILGALVFFGSWWNRYVPRRAAVKLS